MSSILLPGKFRQQPHNIVSFSDGHNPSACVIGSIPVELVGKKSRSESEMLNAVRSCGRVRTAVDRYSSDTYPVNVPAITDFTLYLYASYVDCLDAYQYLLGVSKAPTDYLGIPAAHNSIGGAWGLFILAGGGAANFISSNEILPQNKLTAIVITRTGSTIKLFRDGVLKNTATNSTAPGAMSNLTFNSAEPNGGFGSHTGTYCPLAGLESRSWSDAEIRDFSSNPWGIFRTSSRKIYYKEPGAGPTFFDTDFSYASNSVFTPEKTNIFSLYYNFNGLTDTAINDSIVIASKTNISGTASSNIQSQVTHSVTYTADGTCVVTYKVGPDPIPSTFVQDSFSGVPGQEIQVYNSDWYRSVWGIEDHKLIISDEQRIFASASVSATPVFFHRNIPATPDYDVSADIHIKTAVETVGLIGRANDTTRDHYLVQFTSSFVKLFRVINWANGTLLQQKSLPLTAGQTYNLKLSMFGDVIKVYVDGIEQLSVTDATPITSKGSAGIRYYFENALTNTTGMHIDNFLAQNTNELNKNIISINMFPSGTSVTDPKIQSIISGDLSSNGSSVSDIDQTSINNVEVNTVSVTTSELLDSIIKNSEMSTGGLSTSSITQMIVRSLEVSLVGGSEQITETQARVNVDTNITGSSNYVASNAIIKNNTFDISGVSATNIKSAYAHLCELVSESLSVASLISSVSHSTEINSIGSCVISFEEGADGGTTFVNVDLIINGSSITFPTIQKVFSTDLSTFGNSSSDIKDQIIKTSNISLDGSASGEINAQKMVSSAINFSGSSQASIINNVVINSRIISESGTTSIIDSMSFNGVDLESVGSSLVDFLDKFTQATDFLSNGTSVVSLQVGGDTGTVYINVDFVANGTSSINTDTGKVLNSAFLSQSSGQFIPDFTKIHGQDFSSAGSSIVDIIREYLILQTNRKYVSSVERRNYTSRVERRNYVSRVKRN